MAASPRTAKSRVQRYAGTAATGTARNPLNSEETLVNNIVYIVGAVVIIIALLSFFGLR
jgi:hypothetical protein